MENYAYWMQQCIELGWQALQGGNPPVGALLVNAGKVVGRGLEAGKSKNDITCHAETEAIRDAIENGQDVNMKDCTLYTTHEPCILCSYVIRHHRIGMVVMGMDVAHIGGASSAYPILKTRDIAIWSEPPLLIHNILQEECEQLTIAYQSRLKAKERHQ
jgi:tRNA(adenine34) deaminase